jgi:hypothetical protein
VTHSVGKMTCLEERGRRSLEGERRSHVKESLSVGKAMRSQEQATLWLFEVTLWFLQERRSLEQEAL